MGLRIQVDAERVIPIPVAVENKGAEAVNAYVLKETGVDVEQRRKDHEAAEAERRARAAAAQPATPATASDPDLAEDDQDDFEEE